MGQRRRQAEKEADYNMEELTMEQFLIKRLGIYEKLTTDVLHKIDQLYNTIEDSTFFEYIRDCRIKVKTDIAKGLKELEENIVQMLSNEKATLNPYHLASSQVDQKVMETVIKAMKQSAKRMDKVISEQSKTCTEGMWGTSTFLTTTGSLMSDLDNKITSNRKEIEKDYLEHGDEAYGLAYYYLIYYEKIKDSMREIYAVMSKFEELV